MLPPVKSAHFGRASLERRQGVRRAQCGAIVTDERRSPPPKGARPFLYESPRVNAAKYFGREARSRPASSLFLGHIATAMLPRHASNPAQTRASIMGVFSRSQHEPALGAVLLNQSF